MLGSLLNDRYRLESQLGQGGMGVVYRAYDTLLERTVAVKVLGAAGLDPSGRARLLREARAAAQLNHPNIVAIYDAGEAAGQPYIVMELVEGQSLHDRRPAALDETLRIAGQVCAALAHAHSHGIIHRDLKPENILLTASGQAKLTDFGLARSLASRLTSEGSIVGTVFYIAPELALGEPADGRADLYALGVLLYELCAGQLPFTADDPLAVISQHLYAPVVPPRAIRPALPAALDSLIVRLMAKRPEDRPADAAQVRAALREIAAGHAPATLEPVGLDRLARGRLVGRERELADVLTHWRQAMAGEGHVLLISGEPGIGKTRLARELVAQARVSKAVVLLGECYSEGSGPYGPIAQAIREALGGPALELPLHVVADLVALAPELRTRYPDIAPNPPLEPQAEQQRLFESVVTLCSTLAARQPLLLFVDDAHWADSGSLFLLRHLARRMRQQRLLLVLTYREVELDQACCLQDVLMDLHRERLAARLKLGRFDRPQTGEMLAAMLSPAGEVAPALVEAIYRETEGNPFFIEEVCKALVEEEKLCFEAGRWSGPAGVEIDIPQSVRMTIQSRLGKLPEPAQETLRLAAVLGREFDFVVLSQASDLDEDALIAALESAEKAQLIDEVHRGSRVAFLFAHALVPTTLREGMSGLRRRRLHRRALEATAALRPDDYNALAYHAEQSGNEEKAGTYYRQAGDRALQLFANQEAERHYRAALEAMSDTAIARRAPLLANLGEALFREGRFAEAAQSWRDAAVAYLREEDSDNAARLYARAGRAIWYKGDTAGALALCHEGLAAVAGRPESAGLAALLHEAGRAHYFQSRGTTESCALCQQALEIARRLGATEVQADALSTLGLLPGQPHEQALQYLTEAVEIAESAGLLFTAARTRFNLGTNLNELVGNSAEARKQFERVAELGRQMGAPGVEAPAHFALTSMAINQGELDRAAGLIANLRQLLGSIESIVWQPYLVDMLEAARCRMLGERDRALQLLRQARDQARERGDAITQANATAEMSMIYCDAGAWAQAEAELDELAAATGERFGVFGVLQHIQMSWVQVARGELAAGRQSLDRARELAGPYLRLSQRHMLLWAEARLTAAERRWEESWAAFADLAGRLDRIGLRWYRARVLVDWAEAHRARGEAEDREHARALLQDALELFEAIGGTGYVEQVRKMRQEA